MYGYLRTQATARDPEDLERDLRDLADAEGFCYAATFHEPAHTAYGHPAFDELLHELTRAQAHHAAIPSLEHLSPDPRQQRLLLHRLAVEANARVWRLDEYRPRRPATRSR